MSLYAYPISLVQEIVSLRLTIICNNVDQVLWHCFHLGALTFKKVAHVNYFYIHIRSMLLAKIPRYMHLSAIYMWIKCWILNDPDNLGQYHGWWFPGSLRGQIIGKPDIRNRRQTGLCFQATCTTSILRNYSREMQMYHFSNMNLARWLLITHGGLIPYLEAPKLSFTKYIRFSLTHDT